MHFGLVLGSIAFLALFYSWTARINSFFFFGRTVDSEIRASQAGRAITREYLGFLLITTGVALLMAVGVHVLHASLASLGILVEIACFSLIFARANKRAGALASSQPSSATEMGAVQVDLMEPAAYWIPGLVAALLPGFFAIAALGTAFLLTRGSLGFPAWWTHLLDSLGTRGLDGVFGMTLGALTASLILLLGFRPNARLRTRMAQYTVRSSIVMAWISAVLMPTVLLMNAEDVHLTRRVEQSIVAVMVVIVFATLVWNQARSRRFVPPSAELGGDDRWRWGLFYINRNDPALFVQSRCGAGYTVNYGKVAAWPITAIIWGYVILMLFMAPHYL